MDTSLKDAECPICFARFDAEIYLCATGHSFCGGCTKMIRRCPICKKSMRDQRNYALEGLLKQVPAFRTPDVVNNNYSCPLEGTCKYFYTDLNSLRNHLKTEHEKQFYTCKSNDFSVGLKHSKNRALTIYAANIFEYNNDLFKLCIKVNYDNNWIYFAMQMIDSMKNHNLSFQIDCTEYVRKNKTKVSNSTKIEDAFVSSYTRLRLHSILCEGKNNMIVYGRFVH